MSQEKPTINQPIIEGQEVKPKVVSEPSIKTQENTAPKPRTPEQDSAKEFLRLQSAEFLDHPNKMARSLNKWTDLRGSAQLIGGTPRGILQSANELREVLGTEKIDYERVAESANKVAKNFEISRNQKGNYDADLLKGLVFPAREMARVSADLRKNVQIEGGDIANEAVSALNRMTSRISDFERLAILKIGQVDSYSRR